MTIEEKLKSLIIEKYGNMVNFCKEIDMANSTLATIMKSGVHKANITSIIKICKALGISADELANDRIVPVNENNPVMEYARKLSNLSPDNLNNVLKYIDFLEREEKE